MCGEANSLLTVPLTVPLVVDQANYTPSEVEVKHIVDWLDINKDGRITFDEYCMGMAKVPRGPSCPYMALTAL